MLFLVDSGKLTVDSVGVRLRRKNRKKGIFLAFPFGEGAPKGRMRSCFAPIGIPGKAYYIFAHTQRRQVMLLSNANRPSKYTLDIQSKTVDNGKQ